MKTQVIILILLFFMRHQTTFSQETKNQSRVFFSASLGPAFGRAKQDIEKGMRDSGLDDTMEDWFFGGSNKYPSGENYLVHELELGYYLQGMHGISVDYGIHSLCEVAGFQNAGLGNFVRLNSRTRFAALNYYLSLDNRNHNFFAGPVFLFRTVKNDDGNNISEPTHQNFPGFNIGYSGKIFNKKWWFVAVKMVYRWAPEQKTGPFSTSHQTGISTEVPETHTSTFNETSTRMSSFNILLSAGLNLHQAE